MPIEVSTLTASSNPVLQNPASQDLALQNPMLQDIIQNVKIHADFSIHHPDYLTLELPETAIERFQRLSQAAQDQYLKLRISTVLYDLYFVGSQADQSTQDASIQIEQNATTLNQNWDFCATLHRNNYGTGYFDPGWRISQAPSEDDWTVQKQGLTLHIQPDRHLQASEQLSQIDDIVAVRLPSNLFEQGYYVAVSNAGLPNGAYPPSSAGLLSVYFNLSPDGTIAMMAHLTQSLNQVGIPFSFKIRYDSEDFDRWSTAILTCQREHYGDLRPVLEKLYRECQEHFRPKVPLFTKVLAPGLAISEEPESLEVGASSFGLHRCQLVASGLLAARNTGDDSPAGRLAAIQHQFSALGLTLQQPYLNVNSADIYAFWDENL
ncbi:MAG: hypothetical protein B0A82_07770 [Alkalinema sp. CACIAM 70d]|nr:MAG: hypothetical protein B0A82_07770 [Alkalinema sp. CACIAM 70d]